MWPFRRKEQRAITDVPWDQGGSSGGAAVTQDRALTLAPVYAANRHIGDNISTLPLQAFRKIEERRVPAPLPQLFRLMDDAGVLIDWVFVAITSLALRGNAVGLITLRDGMGFPMVIVWLSMDDIFVDDSGPNPIWYWKGRRMDRSELVHIPWFTIAGRTLGLAPIEAYALTVTSGLESQKFGNDWFEAGGVPPGKFKNSQKKVDQLEADVIKARLVQAIRSRRPLVYGADWDYDAITIPPEQAQFIETMKLTANQIAAIYGIDPTEIGGEAGNSQQYANEEFRQIRRMQDLRAWMVRLETKFSSWIPERQYVRFNANAPVRADLKTRHDVYKLAREIGLRNIDELRAFEDEPPLPNGAGQDYTPLGTRAPATEARPNEALPAPRSDPSTNGHRIYDPAAVD